MPKLAIIGDGYSAAVLVYHVIKRGFNPQDITVFGLNELGFGQAYGSQHAHYRLNVRDNLMRIDPDKPDDFVQWAKDNIDDPGAHGDAGSFYRRRDFARYMKDRLKAITQNTPIQFIRDHVESISRDDQWKINTKTGQYDADLLVIATGNPKSIPNFTCDDSIKPCLTDQPWQGDWAQQISPHDDLVIIGGGLTAMDILASLSAENHNGQIKIISPKGILPPPQLDWRDQPEKDFQWPKITSASEMIQVMNKAMRAKDWLDREGQERFEQLRKGISPVWRSLSDQDQMRLKKHIGWLWQLLRYRAAPQTVAAQRDLSEQGQLSLIKGRVKAITACHKPETDHKITVQLKDGQVIDAHHGFIATGAGPDPLLTQMGSDGVARLKHGHLDVSEILQITRPDGSIHKDGFALGPPTVMSRGDVIGATTIAGEAALIADAIIDHVKDVGLG